MGNTANSNMVGVFSMQTGMRLYTLLPFTELLTFFYFPISDDEKKEKCTMERSKDESRHKKRNCKLFDFQNLNEKQKLINI